MIKRKVFYKLSVANNDKVKLGNDCLFIEPIESYLYQVTVSHLHPLNFFREMPRVTPAL